MTDKDTSKLEELKAERAIIAEDKAACELAYDNIRLHVRKRMESQEKMQFFLRWSGKDAVMGSLELAIHHLHDLLERYDQGIEDQRVRESSAAGDNVVDFPEIKK